MLTVALSSNSSIKTKQNPSILLTVAAQVHFQTEISNLNHLISFSISFSITASLIHRITPFLPFTCSAARHSSPTRRLQGNQPIQPSSS
jgi:hypothetical protein